ncbi:MAG TPA: glycosyl hydrolase 115 family protein [Opitutaceae bacterium]
MIRRFPTTHLLPVLAAFLAAVCGGSSLLAAAGPWVSDTAGAPAENRFPLAGRDAAAPLWLDGSDWPGVLRAARDLQADIERVTGVHPALETGQPRQLADAVIIGTVGRSALIDDLAARGKIDVSAIRGRWEAFHTEVVADPLPGISRALVIAGSDKRGTIYGIYHLSEEIGVSPWYWWADVPVVHRPELHVSPDRHVEPGPAVKYRGIFLNDEAPALTGWVNEKFGGYTHSFYERVFELLLRLRANYLWPAMWDAAFSDDDPLNPQLADEYGVVMGTSHHEPMMRAHKEWRLHGRGAWNYGTNADVLREFWTAGIQRNRPYENIVTLGMRGDGDEPMSEEANVALLQRIVADQRAILAEHVNRDVTQVPQLWALYKEVQEYYEKGMRVPDDVTLLWCDDNWSNLRRVPTAAERSRAGGAGIYYHFDYVGGPRSYKWLNTVPITKTWEQMHLAYEHGADRIWIVNVGDLKPMEFPIEFFLRYAWAPGRIPQENLGDYGRRWAARQFGESHAEEIAALIAAYTKFNGRRKPELLAPETFSLIHYREAETVLTEWQALVARAERVGDALAPQFHDAFFQLVLWPIRASAVVNELHVTAGRNRLYAVQGRASTNLLAERARELFRADAELARAYNELGNGRWRHFADQAHLGYTYWQQPEAGAMPAVTEIQLRDGADMAVAVEGSPASWPHYNPGQAPLTLPPLDRYSQRSRWIEVFNRGREPFSFKAETDAPWLRVEPAEGTVGLETRLEVSVDWSQVPAGARETKVTIKGPSRRAIVITVPLARPTTPPPDGFAGFIETGGVVAIEAAHTARRVEKDGLRWQTLADYGRTDSAVTAFPSTAPSRPLPLAPDAARLEYDIHLASAGEVTIELHVSPTLPFVPGRGIRCAVSIDEEEPQVVDIAVRDGSPEWARAVSDAIHRASTRHRVRAPGVHVVKFWPIDPGVVLQRIVIDAGGLQPSYLGPPESPRR